MHATVDLVVVNRAQWCRLDDFMDFNGKATHTRHTPPSCESTLIRLKYEWAYRALTKEEKFFG